MMEFYKDLCRDETTGVAPGAYAGWDPMLGEASAMCRKVVSRLLSFSPPPFPPVETPGSPEYRPVSALWNKVADLNDEAAALDLGNVVHFDLGVQLTQEVGDRLWRPLSVSRWRR